MSGYQVSHPPPCTSWGSTDSYSLAWTELYLTLGMMFRRYKFELFEPDVRDVQLGHDFFIPVPRLESKGVRVFVTSATD